MLLFLKLLFFASLNKLIKIAPRESESETERKRERDTTATEPKTSLRKNKVIIDYNAPLIKT